MGAIGKLGKASVMLRKLSELKKQIKAKKM